MNPAQSLAAHTAVSAAEQARTIRRAQSAGREILAWTATLATGGAVILLAPTDRVARTLLPGAQRVAPAAVRDVAALISRALAAAPLPPPRESAVKTKAAPRSPVDRAFEREWNALLAEESREREARAYWTTGEGPRPVLPVVSERRIAGQPRTAITARPRPGVGAPFVGEASLVGTGRHTRAAHEYVPEKPVAPEWATPRMPAAPLVTGRRRAPSDPIFWAE